MFKISPRLPILLALIFIACGKSSDSKKAPDSADQTPGTPIIPGEGGDQTPIVVTPVPVQPMLVKALKDRSTEEYCLALSEFLQNFTATKLNGTSLSLMKIDGSTCRMDSSATNLNVSSSLIFSRGQSSLRLAINFYAPYAGDTFGQTVLLVDRLAPKHETFVPDESDKVFGDLSSFRSELQAHVELKSSPFKIYGVSRSVAYQRVEKAFAAGNTRSLIASPKLRLELTKPDVKFLEIDPSYFREEGMPSPFLRCASASCLTNVSYGFQGLDLILYAKPYVGPNNTQVKAPTPLRILADWLK